MEAQSIAANAEHNEDFSGLNELNLAACEFVIQERAPTHGANSRLFLKRAEDDSIVMFNAIDNDGYDGNLGTSTEVSDTRASIKTAIDILARTDRLYAPEQDQHELRSRIIDTPSDSEPYPTSEHTAVKKEDIELFTIHSLRDEARVRRKASLMKELDDTGQIHDLNERVQADPALAVELYIGDNESTVVKLVGFAHREMTDPVTQEQDLCTVAVLQDRFGNIGYQPPHTLVTNLVAKQPEV